MQHDKQLKCLDQLIADLGGADTGTRGRGPCDLLLEHLQAARRDLLGSMLGEYRASLQYAEESVVCIADRCVRADTKKILQSLLDSEVPKQRRPGTISRAFLSPSPMSPSLARLAPALGGTHSSKSTA
jgi:hypothetical protein